MKKPMQFARKLLGLCFLLVTAATAHATTYYFSSSEGDDSRNSSQAQNPASPWKSLAKLNAIFNTLKPGDFILFKRGDVFVGNIIVSESGNPAKPITLAAYGSGEKPVITGFVSVGGWHSVGNNIYEADVPNAGSEVNVVTFNGNFQPVGRYPNSTATNGGYLVIDSYSGNSSISDNQLSSNPNWNGGEVVIRKNRWILDRNRITGHNGNTISYSSASGYHATNKYGYFIQNHRSTLDQNGEWYFQNQKLGVYSSSGSPSVQASVVPVLVSLSNQRNISFSDLTFSGANANAFEIQNARDITISGCEILSSGINAVESSNTQDLKITASEIRNTNNVALNLNNCSGTIVQGNTIAGTGTVAGMGKSGDGTYSAILMNGDNNLLEGNTIENTGYVPVSFNGSSVTVKNNFINRYTLVKDDGGGIYTWNNSNNPPNYANRKVIGNIVLNGQSASAGTDDASKKFSHGIYIDDNAANIEMTGNTVANCEGFGFFIHNARDLSIKNNTSYNNTVQIAMVHDDIAPNSPIRNTDVRNNIFFSLLASQGVAEYKSRRDDLQDFGSFDENYYDRPVDDEAVIGTLKNINGNYIWRQVDVEGWQAMHGKDLNSKGSPKRFASYTVNGSIGNNKYGNGNFNSNIGGLYGFAPANNFHTSWNGNGLDGGTLAASFSSLSNNSKGTLVIGAGSFVAGKKYLLRFSVKGSNENKMLDVYLRNSGAPYNDIAERKLIAVKPSRREIEILFVPTETTNDGAIGIDVQEQSSPVYFDNIDLREVSATNVNLADSIKFIYNATGSPANTGLGGNYIDVKGAGYSGMVAIAPFSSVVLLANGGVIVPPPPPQATCSATGTILHEQWNNVSGNDIANIPLSAQPSSSGQLTIFESRQDAADQYGARVRGYICPPYDGAYTFFIAGDDATELWLSTNDDPSLKKKIAYSLNWTGFREWNKNASQKSVSIYLEAGKKYYIEALHKEGIYGDHLSVAWQLPDGTMEAPIAGSRLSPFQPVALQAQTISFAALATFTLGNTPL
ncbi:MAG TPA: right-handed parallel beta-helix repeat-containing protein, partial [Flavisolibacter sp.]